MSTLNARANTYLTATGSTWSTTANAVDGVYGATNSTYATFTSLVASAVGVIDIGFGTQLSAGIPANAVITNVSVTIRHLETVVASFTSVKWQPVDNATLIGTAATATLTTANHADAATFTPTVAQVRSSTFKIRVTATRAANTNAGNFSLDNVDVVVTYTAPPVTSFSASATAIGQSGTVVFTDTSTGDAATSWAWNFGAGATPATATSKGPHTVTYDTVGTSTVTHSATNTAGTVSASNQSVVVSANPKISTVTDVFDAKGTWVYRDGKTTILAGQARCQSTTTAPAYTGMDQAGFYSLRDSQIWIEVPDAGNMTLTSWNAYPIDLGNGASSHIAIMIGGGSIAVDLGNFGLWGNTPYNPVSMRWVRIRETGGTTYFETSPDSYTWTTFYSRLTNTWPSEMNPDRLVVAISAGTWQTESTLTAMYVDNLNASGPSFSQDAYNFYIDGSESTAAALGTQDTPYSQDVSTQAQAAVFQLRVRLQSKSSTYLAGNSSDTWQLQWEKNSSGTWTNVTGTGADDVYATGSSYVSEGASTTNRLTGGTGTWVVGRISADGEATNPTLTPNNFTELLYVIRLNYAKLYHGDVVRFRVLYRGLAAPMTYTVFPTVMVQSVLVSMDAYRFYFEGSETASLPMVPQDTPLPADVTAGDLGVLCRVRLQSLSPISVPATTDWSHSYEKNGSGTWIPMTAGSTNVEQYNAAGLTAGAATTNRLAGGTGAFEAGKVGEFDIADCGMTANNFTEVLFTVRVIAADVVEGDTFKIRLNRNATTAGMVYTSLPAMVVRKTALKTEALVDSFDTQVDKVTKWPYSSAEITWDAGRAKIPCLSYYPSLHTVTEGSYNLTGSYLLAKVTPPPVSASRETFMELYRGTTNADRLSMFVSGSDLFARRTIDGVHSGQVSIPYDPVAHAWWRIRELGGTVFFEYSADGSAWYTLWVTAPGFVVTTMYIVFDSGYWGTESPSDAYIDNVNLPLPSADPVSVVRSGRGGNSATCDIDVTGGRTLFIVRTQTASTAITTDNPGVTLLTADTVGPRRTSVWAIAEGTSGIVRFTSNLTGYWGYVLIDKPAKDSSSTSSSSNTTADVGALSLYSTVNAPVVVFWGANGQADWSAASGFTGLDVAITPPLSTQPAWNLSYRRDPVPYGAYTTPAMSRGREGTSLYESIAMITLAGYVSPGAGKPKVWSGTAWVNKPAKVWNGSAWVASPAKLWDTWDFKALGTASKPLALVRSGRGLTSANVDVDVTGGQLLFVVANNTHTSLSSNNPGVTLLATDTGGPRRNSIWAVAPGTTGVVRITGTSSATWGYVLLNRSARDAIVAYIGNNSTDVMESQNLAVTAAPAHVVVFWNVNNSADWATPPGFTMLETITTQNAETSWAIGYTTNPVPVGTYATPALSRGKNGTSRIELEAIASVV